MTFIKPPIIWMNSILFFVTFFMAIILTPLWGIYQGFDWIQITLFIATFFFGGLSITAGYHRLWCHKSYQAHPALKRIFAIGGAFAMQNSILHWASDHRNHHRYVDDNEKDPYSAKRGFWYSHMGWMLRHYHKQEDENYNNCKDLQKDPIVMWQHKYYLPLMLSTNLLIPMIFGLIHGDFWGSMILIGVARLVANHHCTFFINSLAHIWGKQPYNQSNTARDNSLLAFFTFGEGYHNFHHIFQSDYRNGIYWWQFDPTKWLIKATSWGGLAKKLRVTPPHRIEKARAKMMLTRIQESLILVPNTNHRMQILEQEYDAFMIRMLDYYEAKKRLIELKKKNLLKKYETAILVQQLQILKCDFKKQKQSWLRLTEKYA